MSTPGSGGERGRGCTRLNLGCGHDARPGWVNLDRVDLPGVDVVHDLDHLPLPFHNAQFTDVDCQDVLEHLDVIPTMRELHRITAPGGRLRIRSPHFTSFLSWADPTHRRTFSALSFSFFLPGQALEREYYFDFAFSAITNLRIEFHKTRLQPWNVLVEKAVNRSARTQYYYEATFLARLFPALNVEVCLIR